MLLAPSLGHPEVLAVTCSLWQASALLWLLRSLLGSSGAEALCSVGGSGRGAGLPTLAYSEQENFY